MTSSNSTNTEENSNVTAS